MKNNTSDKKTVDIKILPADFWLYANPNILMMHFKGGKRAEAGQWTLEIQKMLRGIVESAIGLENMMNQANDNRKLYLEDQEIKISDEKKYWMMIYLADNAILRIYACLDKIAQMCRCYFEDKSNGGVLDITMRCGCKDIMTENNCTFGALINTLNSKDNKEKRNSVIRKSLNSLNGDKSIMSLRSHRNTFTHKKHSSDQSAGLDPTVTVEEDGNGQIKTSFSFGAQIPSVNWFRVETVNAHNAIIKSLQEMSDIIFPKDFVLKRTKK